MPKAIGEADVLDEVGRVGQARLAGPVIQDAQPARAGHEVDPVAAEIRVRVAVAVVQDERGRGGREGPLDHVAREEDPPAGVGREPRVEQPLAEDRPADLHPDRGHDLHRLVEDPVDELVAEHVQGRPHQRSLSSPTLPFAARQWPGFSGRGIPMPLASRLMVPGATVSW